MTPRHFGYVIELHTEIILIHFSIVSQGGSEKCLLNTTGPYPHELTAAGAACTRPNQSAFQHGNGETREPPSLAEELLTVDSL